MCHSSSAASAAALPRAQNIGLAWPVAVFAVGVSILTGLVFGLVPAVQAMRSNVRQSLNEEGRGGFGGVQHRKTRATLVVVEVGLALVLLVGAGLLLRSFSTLTQVPPGFNPENLLVVNLPLSPQKYARQQREDGGRRTHLETRSRLAWRQGRGDHHRAADGGRGGDDSFQSRRVPAEAPGRLRHGWLRAVTPGYFATIGVPLRRGRTLTEQDRQGAPLVAVINESMARQFFPEMRSARAAYPAGHRAGTGFAGDRDRWRRRGREAVVSNGRPRRRCSCPMGSIRSPSSWGCISAPRSSLRTKGDPASVTPSVRAAIRAVDPEQPLVNVRTMETAIENTRGAAAPSDEAVDPVRHPRGHPCRGRRLQRHGVYRVAADSRK